MGVTYLRDEFIVVGEVRAAVHTAISSVTFVGQVCLKGFHHGDAVLIHTFKWCMHTPQNTPQQRQRRTRQDSTPATLQLVVVATMSAEQNNDTPLVQIPHVTQTVTLVINPPRLLLRLIHSRQN